MLRNNHYHYSETYLVAAAERGNRLEEVRREWEAKIQSGELDPGDEEFDRFERKYDDICKQQVRIGPEVRRSPFVGCQ